jgi:hypothetical protein
MINYPRVTFGIIVINGEPFTRYCLRSLYRFAHEIIVVEGGHEGVRAVATPDGHSVDGTLEALHRFKREEDPENKVQIVTRDGFWPQKDELGRYRTAQSRAYAERATGEYLWQVDIDEFYRPADMQAIFAILRDDPSITAVTFPTRTFWGRPAYAVDGWPLRRGSRYYHRLFKWGPGYRYVTHEPPTVCDAEGRDVRDLRWLNGKALERLGVYMYHYSLLFPWQVKQKVMIYHGERRDDCGEIVQWAERNYFSLGNPYRVHNRYRSPSWLERFPGEHPPEVSRMMKDITEGGTSAELRPVEDAEKLLGSWWYPLGREGLRILDHVDRGCQLVWRQLLRASHAPRKIWQLLHLED